MVRSRGAHLHFMVTFPANVCVAVMLLGSSLAWAGDPEPLPAPADPGPLPAPADPPPSSLDVHGFVSQGFIKTTENEYLAKSKRGSFEFSEVGVNVTKSFGDALRVGLQLFTRDLGAIGNYRARFDWFYIDYNFFDWLGVRAGRTKLPFGLYNETSDIDSARVPILLPQSIYPTASRDLLLAQTGVEVYGYIPLGGAGAFDYRLYGGTLYIDAGDSSTARITRYDVPYVLGGKVSWFTPLTGLQLGGTVQALRLDGDYVPSGPDDPTLVGLEAGGFVPAGTTDAISFKIPALLWVASLEYIAGDLTIASEYSRGWADMDIATSVRTSIAAVTSESMYVMGSYRVNPWFDPGVYYSLFFPNIDHRRGRAAYQHDVALTLRFDLTANWLLKAEVHYMHGTAGLDAALNQVALRDQLEADWGVLLLKTTAYF
jgi:hypothetical protein